MLGFYVRFLDSESLSNVIKTVGRSYSWASPNTIKEMYCDDDDYHGLMYWYKDVEEQNKELESKVPKKKKK